MDTTNSLTNGSSVISAHGVDVGHLDSHITQAMDQAVANGELPGGVVSVMRNGEQVFLQAYGNRAVAPEVEPATTDTLYDLASLTKPIVTATSIMILVQRGKIRLSDPVKKYIPEWTNTPEETAQSEHLRKLRSAVDKGTIRLNRSNLEIDDKEQELQFHQLPAQNAAPAVLRDYVNLLPRDRESITIRHLLTHTSGLPPFFRYYEQFPEGDARQKIINEIAQAELRAPVGEAFIYSDLGFITMGEIVERVTSMPLNQFAQQEIFSPLGMTETMFTPPSEFHGTIAPTEWTISPGTQDEPSTKTMMRGLVHDGNAKIQNGISGHAGLFSTATDLAKYIRMLLNVPSASTDNANILSPATIEVMTTNQIGPGIEAKRGLGWDINSSFSSQRGDIFQSGYGHTGFTGTSIWIVPEEKLAIIILSNRVHPNGKGDVTSLRAKIANIVAGSIVESYRKEHSEIKQ